MRVGFSLALLVTIVLPAAFGQENASTPAEKPDDRVNLLVYAPDPNTTSVWERSTRTIFEEFIRTHPHINVRASQTLQMENVGNSGGLLAIAGGISPDVFSLYYQAMHTYIEQNFVAPVDEYLETWEKTKEVPEQLWEVATGSDGKRYGAIYTWPTLYLIYRRDLFEEAGLDPKRGPRDWNELYEYAMKLSRPDMIVETAIDPAAKAGLRGLFLQTSGSWILSNFIWQAGGDIVSKRKEDGRWQAVFDGPEAVKALEFWKMLCWVKWTRCFSPQCSGKNVVFEITDDMMKSGAVTCQRCGMRTTIDDLKQKGKLFTGVIRNTYGARRDLYYHRLFGRGEVAMMLSPLSQLQQVINQGVLNPSVIGIAPLPAGPTGIRASIVDGDIWCIASAIRNDKRKMDAAWEYIRFFTSEEAERIETKIYVESNYARFLRNPRWLEKYGYKEYFNEIDKQQLSAFDEALDYGRPEPYCPGYASISMEMDNPVQAIFDNKTGTTADCPTLLADLAKRINTHFFKLYPEDEMRHKRRAAVALAAMALIVLCVLGYSLVKALAERVAAAAGGAMSMALKASRWKHIYAWLFLAPAVLTILIWSYVPLIRGSFMAVYDYKIMPDLTGQKFAGLDNFIEAMSQSLFWESIGRTFFYTSLTMTFGFFTPIFLALFLAEVPKFKITFRMLFYLPALTSGLVIMFLWKDLFFNPSEGGLLNRMLQFYDGCLEAVNAWAGGHLSFLVSHLTIGKQDWLQDKRLAMYCIVLPGIWAGAGAGSIIYLAALKTVPDEMYEAAEMDGAGVFQKVFLVTLPYLKPLLLINFLGAFIGSFQATQNIFAMTMGGPQFATHTLSLEIFLNAFVYLKFGYATAMAWIMGSMLVGFTLYQLRIFQRVQFTAGGSA